MPPETEDFFRPYTRPKDQLLGPRWKRILRERLAFLRFVVGAPFEGQGPTDATIGRQDQTRLNIRLMGQTLAVVVVVLPSLLFWHRYQVYRNANSLLVQARKAEKEERWGAAADYCQRYLQLRPNDADTWVRLARNFDRKAVTGPQLERAIGYYRKAVTLRDEDPYLRRRLAELYLETRQAQLAEYHADQLLLLIPEDPAGWRVRARALYVEAHEGNRVQLATAVDAMKKAVALNPQDALMAVTLADIYRRELPTPSQAQRNALADDVMNFLVRENPESVNACLARYSYRTRYRLDGADEDLDRALVLDPNNLDVLLAAGQRATRQTRYDEARRYFTAVIEQAPNDRRGYLSLGETYLASNLLDQAVTTWRNGLARVGETDLQLNLPLATTLIRLRKLDEAEQILSALDLALRNLPIGMSSTAKSQARLQVDFVRARWLVGREEYARATPILRRVLNELTNRGAPEDLPRTIEAQYELAGCALGERQPDLAAALYVQAARLQPSVAAHYVAAGRAFDLAGQSESAIEYLNQALKLEPNSPSAWLAMAQAVFNAQRSAPEGQRQWGDFEQALAECQKHAVDPTALRLLRADYLAIQGRGAEAVALVEAGLAEQPGSRLLAQALVLVQERYGDQGDADRALDALEKTGDRTPQATLLRVAVLAKRRQFAEAERLLTHLAERSTGAQKLAVSQQLAELLLQQRKIDPARKLLESLYDRHPDQRQLAGELARLALESGDRAAAEIWENRLRVAEGSDGTQWRYLRAMRLLGQGTGTNDAQFSEAVRLQAEIQANRPNSPMGYVLKGQIEERRGQPSEAISAYQMALQLGDRSLVPLERVIALLYQQKRLAEADAYLNRMEQELVFSQDTADVAVTVAAQYGQLDRSLRVAAAAVERRPNEPASYVLLGRAHLLSGQVVEAERCFAKATQLAPRDTQGWISLLGFYARTNRPAEVESTLAKMATEAQLGPADRAFLSAQTYELLKDFERAGEFYRQAAREAPDDPQVQERVAMYFNDREPDLAMAALRRLLEIDPDSEVGRRYLVQNLLNRGGRENWEQALSELLRSDDQAPQTLGPDELRLQIAALIKTGDLERRAQAVKLLEELIARGEGVMAEDRLLLARLCEADDKFPQARELYRDLVARPNPEANHVAAFIDFLLRNQQSKDAAPWIAQLEVLAPDDLRTIDLRARWLHQEGRSGEIEPMIERFLAPRLALPANDAMRPEAYWRVAHLLSQVDLDQAAERWYAQAMQLAPERFAELAQWLVSDRRYADAVSLCLEVAQKQSPTEAAIVLCDVLVAAQTPSDLVSRAEPLFSQLLSQSSGQGAFQLALANLRLMQGRDADAVELYRQVLAQDANNVAALNNLALLLLKQADTRAEARQLVERALDLAGSVPGLQDTLGLLLLADDRIDDAIGVLHPLATRSRPDAAVLFHLARAHWLQPSDQVAARDEARWAWDKAIGLGLADQPLTPQEQAWFREMQPVLSAN